MAIEGAVRVFLSPSLFVCPFSGTGAAGAGAAGCRFSAGDVSSFYFSMCGLFGGFGLYTKPGRSF